jgi:membrane-associated phospholipid phosphatase
MPAREPDSRSYCLFVFLLGAILQGISAFSQELPVVPSGVRSASFPAPEGSAAGSNPAESPATGLHRSALKRVVGLPAGTLGPIAIDKHASGALSRNGTSASSDISDVGLFVTAGAVGALLLDGETGGDSHARETGVLGAEAMANSALVYAVLQLITERQRPLQGTERGNFFQTSGLDNSFPSGHTIISWTAANTIAHEYPRPWVTRLTCGTATAISVTRFTSRQHFPFDLVVGGTLGDWIGRHIFHEHCQAGLSPICKKQ